MVIKKESQPSQDFPPGVARPALRALASVGITRLDHCTNWTEADLAQLHGMGPKALGLISAALQAKGKSFAKNSRAKTQSRQEE